MNGMDERDIWWVQARGRAWGPYRLRQLQDFVRERRVVDATLIGPSVDGPWRPAAALSALPFTGPTAERAPVPATPTQRRLRTSDTAPANDREGADANMMVVCELSVTDPRQFEAALALLGRFAPVASNTWVLRTARPVQTVRTQMARVLRPHERMIVVDATHDRLAWFNIGPEADAMVRQVWHTASQARA
jgi:hypothetical protein